MQPPHQRGEAAASACELRQRHPKNLGEGMMGRCSELPGVNLPHLLPRGSLFNGPLTSTFRFRDAPYV